MWGEPKQSQSARLAVIYITAGALIVIWTTVWHIYLQRHEGSGDAFLWCYGVFFSGLVLLGVGFAVGRIGRAARDAEVTSLPPQIVQPAPPPPVETVRTSAGAPAVTVPAAPNPPTPTVAHHAAMVKGVRR